MKEPFFYSGLRSASISSIEITLKPGHTTGADVAAFAESIRAAGPFEDIDYGQEWITRVQTFLSVLNALGVALGDKNMLGIRLGMLAHAVDHRDGMVAERLG